MSILFGTSPKSVSLSLTNECVITIAEKQVTSAQIKEHRGAVLDLIEMYLRGEFMELITVQTAHIIYLVLYGLGIHLFMFWTFTGSGSSVCIGFNMSCCTHTPQT